MFGLLAPKSGSSCIATTAGSPTVGNIPVSDGDITNSWQPQEMMPSLLTQQLYHPGILYMPQSNFTSLSTFGRISAGVNGTNSNQTGSQGCFIGYATAASSGSKGGQQVTATTYVQYNLAPKFITYLMIPASGDLLNMRTWVGFVDVDPTQNDTPQGNYIAFSYATGRDSSVHWYSVTSNSSSNYTIQDTGIAIVAGSAYALAFDASNPNYVVFYINGQPVTTHTNNLPTASTGLGFSVTTTTTNSSAKNIRINSIWLECL